MVAQLCDCIKTFDLCDLWIANAIKPLEERQKGEAKIKFT